MNPTSIKLFLIIVVIPLISIFFFCSLVIVLYPASMFGNLLIIRPVIIIKPPTNKLIVSIYKRTIFQRCTKYIQVRKFYLTARQYGEVVLPDASTGQGPGTPRQRGQKAVTVQGGYGALFAVQVQVLLSITRVAVQV